MSRKEHAELLNQRWTPATKSPLQNERRHSKMKSSLISQTFGRQTSLYNLPKLAPYLVS